MIAMATTMGTGDTFIRRYDSTYTSTPVTDYWYNFYYIVDTAEPEKSIENELIKETLRLLNLEKSKWIFRHLEDWAIPDAPIFKKFRRFIRRIKTTQSNVSILVLVLIFMVMI